jgi:2-C-methyl-D-erythritol 4-phosphate cytidylyltransferase
VPTRVGVAVPAAGLGRRMGGVRKPFLELAGQPVLLRSLRPFLAEPRVTAIAIAVTREEVDNQPEWLTDLDKRIVVVEGGATRGASVACAIAALPGDVTEIAVHDGARPLVKPEVIGRCIDLACAGFGAVAGEPMIDTVKRVDEEDFVTGTPDRSTFWSAHTPQVFPAMMLRTAYSKGYAVTTDDASLVEAVGGRIQMLDDGGMNIKITRPADLVLAEALLSTRGSD